MIIFVVRCFESGRKKEKSYYAGAPRAPRNPGPGNDVAHTITSEPCRRFARVRRTFVRDDNVAKRRAVFARSDSGDDDGIRTGTIERRTDRPTDRVRVVHTCKPNFNPLFNARLIICLWNAASRSRSRAIGFNYCKHPS